MMETHKAQETFKLQYENQNMQKFGIVYQTMQAEQKRRDEYKLKDIDFLREIQRITFADELQNGNINSDNEYIRNKAIEKEVTNIMAQYDGLIMSSKGQLIERIKTDMANGKTFNQSLGAIMLDIRNKPEYKAYMQYKTMDKLGIKI